MNDQEVAAAEQLAEMERARQAVGAKAAKEYTPFIGWGLFVLLMIPAFDVVAGKVWGPVILLVALVAPSPRSLLHPRASSRPHRRNQALVVVAGLDPVVLRTSLRCIGSAGPATGGLDGRGCSQRSAAPRRRHPSATPGPPHESPA